MMVRSNVLLVLLIVVVGIAVAPAFGAQKEKVEKKDAKSAASDPVARAFAPPRGVTLTDTQTEAVEKLRSQHEQKLREALDAVRSAKGDKEKRDAATAAKQIREEIHREMASIFNTQADNTPKMNATKSAANHKATGGFRKTGTGSTRTHGRHK
jgi:hypothetical protein